MVGYVVAIDRFMVMATRVWGKALYGAAMSFMQLLWQPRPIDAIES